MNDTTKRNMKDHIAMTDAILKSGADSAACIAAAAAMDNGLWDTMTDHERHEWTLFAFEIEELISHADEPRFTLYDYLDAAINGISANWVQISAAVHLAIASRDPDTMDVAFERLVEMAAQKRDVYSGA